MIKGFTASAGSVVFSGIFVGLTIAVEGAISWAVIGETVISRSVPELVEQPTANRSEKMILSTNLLCQPIAV